MFCLALTMGAYCHVLGKQDLKAALAYRSARHHNAQGRVVVVRVDGHAQTGGIVDPRRWDLSGKSKCTQKQAAVTPLLWQLEL